MNGATQLESELNAFIEERREIPHEKKEILNQTKHIKQSNKFHSYELYHPPRRKSKVKEIKVNKRCRLQNVVTEINKYCKDFLFSVKDIAEECGMTIATSRKYMNFLADNFDIETTKANHNKVLFNSKQEINVTDALIIWSKVKDRWGHRNRKENSRGEHEDTKYPKTVIEEGNDGKQSTKIIHSEFTLEKHNDTTYPIISVQENSAIVLHAKLKMTRVPWHQESETIKDIFMKLTGFNIDNGILKLLNELTGELRHTVY